MVKKSFIFTKEMAKLFTELRKRAGLSQTEVAARIGLSRKSYPYISYLESGKIKNPTLANIVLYVRACGGSLPEFFKQIDAIDFKMRHEKMIAQLPIPPEKRKIQRDAMKYEIGVEFPSKEKEEVDFERLKKQIKDKVLALVKKEEITLSPNLSHQGRGGKAVIDDYQKFALEYFDFLAMLNKAGMKMVTDKYQRTGLQLNLLFKIKKIINSVLRGEIKRIESKKPLPTEKQEKMAIGFTKYRIKIEQIEAEVHKILCELGIQTPWFSLYKDFSRQCYQILKKYYGKEPERLSKALTELVQGWNQEGLKEDVLQKLKDKIVAIFTGLKMKRLV